MVLMVLQVRMDGQQFPSQAGQLIEMFVHSITLYMLGNNLLPARPLVLKAGLDSISEMGYDMSPKW